MTENEQREILQRAQLFFQEEIIASHLKNIKKLKSVSKFNINPFLYRYLSKSAFNNYSPESIAKALLYPRILGTSISTTFGSKLQDFCHQILPGFASTTTGIDIEFIDFIDNRRKYCQIKAGPNTINYDDITTIKDHFTSIRNLARTNRLPNFNPNIDCIVGVFYGTREELSSSYKEIDKDYPVYIGKEFWHRLTGNEAFYEQLIDSIAHTAETFDMHNIIQETIEQLAADIRNLNL